MDNSYGVLCCAGRFESILFFDLDDLEEKLRVPRPIFRVTPPTFVIENKKTANDIARVKQLRSGRYGHSRENSQVTRVFDCYDPNEDYFAVAEHSLPYGVRVYSVGEQKLTRCFFEHTGAVNDLTSISVPGFGGKTLIVSGGLGAGRTPKSGEAIVWDADNLEVLMKLENVPEGCKTVHHVLDWPDPAEIFVAGALGQRGGGRRGHVQDARLHNAVFRFDIERGQRTGYLPRAKPTADTTTRWRRWTAPSFGIDGDARTKQVVVASGEYLQIWDLRTGGEGLQEEINLEGFECTSCCFSQDENFAVIGSTRHGVLFWDVRKSDDVLLVRHPPLCTAPVTSIMRSGLHSFISVTGRFVSFISSIDHDTTETKRPEKLIRLHDEAIGAVIIGTEISLRYEAECENERIDFGMIGGTIPVHSWIQVVCVLAELVRTPKWVLVEE